MIVTVSANVIYSCFLDEEKVKKVKNYIKEHSDLLGDEISVEEAIMNLYEEDEDFDLYEKAIESDFSTEEIIEVKEKE